MTNLKKENSQSLYKLRKSGNSHIVTIPSDVKETLGIDDGDMIAFNIDDNGVVKISKAEKEIDVDQAIEDTLNQYYELIGELANL